MLRSLILLTAILHLGLSPSLRAETCELGEQIRAFETMTDREALSRLAEDPLFARDDEKYVEALLRLKATDKIKAYIDRTNVGELSSAARERRANALVRLRDYDPAKVSIHLYVDLAETQGARKIAPPALTSEQWLKRIEVLSDHNDNARVISEVRERKGDLGCHAQFLLGKGYRKNRDYKEAIEVLDKVARTCAGNDAVNAAFLLARLAAIMASSENMKFFDRFEQKYPSHSYLDDVLLFKASAQETLGKKEDAKRTLRQIWEMSAPADMRYEAIFRLAFMHALEGKSTEAIDILAKSLRENHTPAATYIQMQRANYWIARLSLFPQVASLKKARENLAATKILSELANAPQPTYYSFMAAQLLQKGRDKKNETVAKNADVVSDARFKTIFCMMAKGYVDEGKRLVELMQPADVQPDQRLRIARKLNDLGLYGDAFRFARSVADDDLLLMYPKAYESVVTEASKRLGPPEYLLYGLMREESLFDARAISWAGAHGAFQLMPSVAKEEGRKFKITDLTKEKLLDPKINILLGAQHLKGMLDEVKHPLFAIAAYNAGLGRVKTWEERWKSYEAVDSFVENIPLPETREYVKRVAGAWITYVSVYGGEEKPFGIQIAAGS